jgi:hypothetical protein
MNIKGQSGDVFKILIGTIVGLAIFGIIYTLIGITQDQQEYMLNEIFMNQMEMAVKNPTGIDYIIEDIKVTESILTGLFLQEKTGLSSKCFSFETTKPPSLVGETSGSINGLIFKRDLELDFVINCKITEEQNCNIECNILVE